MQTTYQNTLSEPTTVKKVQAIHYFQFEEDFVEADIRCIPMIVRYKMDEVGVKLKLTEWVKFSTNDKEELALLPIQTDEQKNEYRAYLVKLIRQKAHASPTYMLVNAQPDWAVLHQVPDYVQQRANEHDCNISVAGWQQLDFLQRFALVKLCKSEHEHKNFIKALQEFELLN